MRARSPHTSDIQSTTGEEGPEWKTQAYMNHQRKSYKWRLGPVKPAFLDRSPQKGQNTTSLPIIKASPSPCKKDLIVMEALSLLLNKVYENVFLTNSHGFRRGRMQRMGPKERMAYQPHCFKGRGTRNGMRGRTRLRALFIRSVKLLLRRKRTFTLIKLESSYLRLYDKESCPIGICNS